jgi:hypothetical protein
MQRRAFLSSEACIRPLARSVIVVVAIANSDPTIFRSWAELFEGRKNILPTRPMEPGDEMEPIMNAMDCKARARSTHNV